MPVPYIGHVGAYSYKLVKMYDDETQEQSRPALEKYAGEGWELVAAPFFPGTQTNWASGYLIFRK
jgi:hypothetical protein